MKHYITLFFICQFCFLLVHDKEFPKIMSSDQSEFLPIILYLNIPCKRYIFATMAVPMASGSAALLLERYPDFTSGQVKLCFQKSCQNLWLPTSQQGWGLIHPVGLLQAGDGLAGNMC